jgi:hypothetical protein
VVTPYGWLAEGKVGDYGSGTAQSWLPAGELLPTEQVDTVPYEAERAALVELTGWLVRHPEFLDKAAT